MPPVVKFIIRRILVGVWTMFAVSVFVFSLIKLLPGDAASAALGSTATPELLAKFRADFGLDRPAIVRYLEWIWNFLHGDLGRAMPSGAPVAELLGPRILNT